MTTKGVNKGGNIGREKLKKNAIGTNVGRE